MPLKKCSEGGKSGWKWGDQGHCYTGKDGKKQAIKQGIAIEGPDKFKQIANEDQETKAAVSEEFTIVEQMMINLAGKPNE